MVRYNTVPETIHTFGTMDDEIEHPSNCYPDADSSLVRLKCECDFIEVTNEIQKFAVFVDADDVEGLLFET